MPGLRFQLSGYEIQAQKKSKNGGKDLDHREAVVDGNLHWLAHGKAAEDRCGKHKKDSHYKEALYQAVPIAVNKRGNRYGNDRILSYMHLMQYTMMLNDVKVSSQ
jgi:hypothetical protein